ncbi:hypothetical protein H4582DRAFT_1198553 [Lactarius indigo]|nr:hypothetical protein H4582DRAFT_1198553 [Lactarius indigo]
MDKIRPTVPANGRQDMRRANLSYAKTKIKKTVLRSLPRSYRVVVRNPSEASSHRLGGAGILRYYIVNCVRVGRYKDVYPIWPCQQSFSVHPHAPLAVNFNCPYPFTIPMSDYNMHHAGTPASGSSAYPSEPQNDPWRAATRPYPAGYPTTANPDMVYEPLRSVGPGHTAYRNDATPWRVTNSEILMQLARNVTSQVGPEVIGYRKEEYGPNHSKCTFVFVVPNDI